MKAIMISIKPKYVAKILNGEKTIEVRKSIPKCGLPIDVYIYCTKNEYLYRTNKGYFSSKKPLTVGKGTEYTFAYSDEGKVVAKFTLNKVEEIGMWNYSEYGTETLFENHLCIKSCLDPFELKNYLKGKNGYAWHISNLEIFDKPKELSEFCGAKQYFVGCESGIDKTPRYSQLTKAPQSWCYVEKLV